MRGQMRHRVTAGFLVALVLASLAACPSQMAGTHTAIVLRTAGIGLGKQLPTGQACIWVMGRLESGEKVAVIVAHGGKTVEECVASGPPWATFGKGARDDQ